MAKIMVVEDDPSVNYALGRILETDSHEIVSVYSGEEALKKLEEMTPDLITLDIMMPGMDGFETLKRIREKKETLTVPVIIVTVRDDVSDIVKGLEIGAIGANDYITKPYNETILLAKTRTLLKLKEIEDEQREYSEELERKVEGKTRELGEAHEKLKLQYYLLEKDLDLANLQMEHDEKKINYIIGLTGIFTLVLISSMIILITTWNIDYLVGLVMMGILSSGFHIWRSQKSMKETKSGIKDLKKTKLEI